MPPDGVYTAIYVLGDPRPGELRQYVGKSVRPRARFSGHLSEARRGKWPHSQRLNWIRELLSLGLKPTFEIVEEVRGPGWPEREKFWMRKQEERGYVLVNVAPGGVGRPPGIAVSALTRQRLRGRRAWNKGKKMSAEYRAKLSRAHRGKKLSEEHKRKIAEAGRGRSPSPETRQKLSEAHRGRTISAETRQRIAKAKRGKKLSEEHKRKIREASGGWTHTAEAKQKISDAKQQYWIEGGHDMKRGSDGRFKKKAR